MARTLLFCRERRDPCFGHCVASVACVMPNYGNRSLLSERSDPKSGGAERSGERALQKNDGAERRGMGGRGAGAAVTGLGWSVERLFRPLRSHALLQGCPTLL